ncbi:MAG: Flp pilus assembly protein CpaB [Sandaracinus sp.]
MNSKAILAAVGAAVLGVVILGMYMQRFEDEASGGEPVLVLTAVQDVPLGVALTADMVVARALPAAYLEDRHITVDDQERVMGVRVVSGIRAGESILWTDLATTTDTSRDLSSLVRNGMRAITIQADQSATFGGLVRPGDRVDVLMTLSRPRATPSISLEEDRVTIALLQNLLVLAAGQDTGALQRQTAARTPTQMNDVTLSTTIEQAQLLAFAQQRGRLTLLLRHPDDITVIEGLPETTTDDIITPERRETRQRTVPRPPPPSQPTTVVPQRVQTAH